MANHFFRVVLVFAGATGLRFADTCVGRALPITALDFSAALSLAERVKFPGVQHTVHDSCDRALYAKIVVQDLAYEVFVCL